MFTSHYLSFKRLRITNCTSEVPSNLFLRYCYVARSTINIAYDRVHLHSTPPFGTI
jgi:hypothetical protein